MLRLSLLTALALIAFAANSLLARAALTDPAMGDLEFTLIRLFSGAALLLILMQAQGPTPRSAKSGWWGAVMLLLYAVMFSLAYRTLDTGLGALCLFASVQLTILGMSAFRGTLSLRDMIGALIAFAGFLYLVWPTLGTPSLAGIAMMALSGVGWGVYTLLGQGASAPLARTSDNFLKASLLALPLRRPRRARSGR